MGALPSTRAKARSLTSSINSGARCADCHKGNYAGNFNTRFASSNHADVTIEESAGCVRCHTHEGAVLFYIAVLTGDYNRDGQ